MPFGSFDWSWPGHSRSKNGVVSLAYARPSTSCVPACKEVDARDKPAHDETRSSAPLYPQLGRELLQARGGKVARHLRRGLAGTGTIFVRAGDVGGGETERSGGLEIVGMRGDHHAVGRREIERFGRCQIDA